MKLVEKVRFQVAIRAAADSLNLQQGALGYRCPFHHDETGTLTLKEQDNRFSCSVCSASGTQIDLVAGVRGLDSDAAVQWLAERFDIQEDDTFQEDLLSAWKKEHAANTPTLSDLLGKADNRAVNDRDREIYRHLYDAASLTDTAAAFLARKGFTETEVRKLGFRFLESPRDALAALIDTFGSEALDHAGLLDRNREFPFQQHGLLIPFRSTGGELTFLAGWDMSASRRPIRFPHGKSVPPYPVLETPNRSPVYLTEDLPGAFAFVRKGYPAIALPGGTLPVELVEAIRDRKPSVCGEQSDDGNRFNRQVMKALQEAHVDVRLRETEPAFEDFLAYLVEKRK